MKTAAGFLVVAVGLLAFAVTAPAQQKKASAPPTIASVMNTQLGIVEHEFVSAAEAMPDGKYSFAPTNGDFKGVTDVRARSEACRDGELCVLQRDSRPDSAAGRKRQ